MKSVISFVLIFLICRCITAQDLTVTSAGYVIPSSTTATFANVNLQQGATLTLGSNSVLTVTGTVNYVSGCVINLETGSTLNAATINMNTGSNGILNIATGAKVLLSQDLNALNPSTITLHTGAALTVQNAFNTDFSNITVNANAIVTVKDFNMNGSTALKLDNAKLNVTNTAYNGFSLTGGILTMTNGSELTVENNMTCNSAAINPYIAMSGGSKIYLKKNLINSHALGSPLFAPGSQPIVILNGSGPQVIEGYNVFYDLICQTPSKKTIQGNTSNTEVQHQLNLGNAELAIGNLTFKITSPSVTAIIRGTGFISNDSYNGVFSRATNQAADYLFPVGGTIGNTVYYRPVSIKPASTVAGEYAAKFIPATVNAHPVNQIGTSLVPAPPAPLNTTYYHKIRKLSGPAASVSIYYHPTTDAAYNAIARWNVPGAETNVWNAINDLSTGNPLTPFLSVRANLYNDFSETEQDFVLAKGKAQNLLPEPTFDVLKKKLDGSYYLTKGKVLYFKFDEEYAVSTGTVLNCKIFTKSRIEIPVNTLPVTYGDNRYQLDASYLNTNEYYTLEVLNSKNEKWLIRFKVD